jgi:acyl-coenzyme A thioesterase PaaI-like protein
LLARGRVLRSGRTLTVCSGDAVTVNDEAEVIVATLLTTMMAVRVGAS